MIGDGCLSSAGGSGRYLVCIAGNSRKDLDFFAHVLQLIKKLFDKSPKIQKRKHCDEIEIHFGSKYTFTWLHGLGFPIGKKRDIYIPPTLLHENLWPHVVRGLFDTDGCLVFSKQHKDIHYYPRIEVTNSSLKLIEQLQNLLVNAGFTCSHRWNGGQSWKLEVAGRKNVKKWFEEIGSNNPRNLERYLIWLKLGYYP